MKKLRIWYIKKITLREYILVSSIEEALKKITSTLNKDSRKKNIDEIIFGLEVLADNEWHEWHDDRGRDITRFIKKTPEGKFYYVEEEQA